MKDIIKVFKALSDPTRLRILFVLLRRELCVCEIMFILNMEQSRISHQMGVLRNAGLVEDVRSGRWIIYRIPREAREMLEGIFERSMDYRFELSPEAEKDRRRFEACLEMHIREKVCAAPGSSSEK